FVTETSSPLQNVCHPVTRLIKHLNVLPGRTVCQQCQQTVLTDTEYTPGCITWLLCILLASIGCFFCFWVPFFHYGCKDVEHRCPSCNNVIHVHKRCTGYSRPRYASQA
uniref:LITAF domain-containing protein n=1 Tax=Salarias fasciatus TaxID=181472 RepID=A0A672F4J5_SALFA